jgi:hypothetical protein
MIKKRRKRKNLQAYAEEFAISLLYEASGGKIGKVKSAEKSEYNMSFHDRRALLDSMTKLMALKHKIEPEEEEDGIASYREQLNGQHGTEIADGGDSSDTSEAGSSDA